MLDTDICIYVIKNRPPEVRDLFNARSEHICLSSITVAELIYGAEKSQRREHNISAVENFTARLDILAFEATAAGHYGDIRANLEREGKLIGPYDLMIAGHARVDGLRVENWLTA